MESTRTNQQNRRRARPRDTAPSAAETQQSAGLSPASEATEARDEPAPPAHAPPIPPRRSPPLLATTTAERPPAIVSERTQIIRIIILGLVTSGSLGLLALELVGVAQLFSAGILSVALPLTLLGFQVMWAFWREYPLRDWIVMIRDWQIRISWPARWLALWLSLGMLEGFCVAKAFEWAALDHLPSSTLRLAHMDRGAVAAVGGMIAGAVSVAILLICLPIFATYAQKYRQSLGYDRMREMATEPYHMLMNWMAKTLSRYGDTHVSESVRAPKFDMVPLVPENEAESAESADSAPTIAR